MMTRNVLLHASLLVGEIGTPLTLCRGLGLLLHASLFVRTVLARLSDTDIG